MNDLCPWPVGAEGLHNCCMLGGQAVGSCTTAQTSEDWTRRCINKALLFVKENSENDVSDGHMQTIFTEV